MPNHKTALPVIVLSVGEPAGIGPDIAVKMAQRSLPCCLIAVANGELLLKRAKQLGLNLKIKPLPATADKAEIQQLGPHQKGSLLVCDIALGAPAVPGKLNKANADYVLKGITTAAKMCIEGKADAMVTGPVHKGAINEAGIPFSGHTEWIAKLCHVKEALMLLASKKLKVALASVHIPLSEVPKNITKENLSGVLSTLHQALQKDFGIAEPHIGVCGLNPHAGEDGHIGLEEKEIISPALEALRAQGLKLSGPFPADTLFSPQRAKAFDAILALYHDQGLAPLKAQYFGEIVNITLGLPIIRTSVDHGTALDVAGTQAADERSLVLAVNYAVKLVQQKLNSLRGNDRKGDGK